VVVATKPKTLREGARKGKRADIELPVFAEGVCHRRASRRPCPLRLLLGVSLSAAACRSHGPRFALAWSRRPMGRA